MEDKILTVQEIGEINIIRITEKKLYQNIGNIFRENMNSLLNEGKRNLIIDLSEVEVINSSGLGVLIMISDRLNKEGGKIVVTGLGSLLKELFQRMRLDSLFTITDTKERAISLIRGNKKIPAF